MTDTATTSPNRTSRRVQAYQASDGTLFLKKAEWQRYEANLVAEAKLAVAVASVVPMQLSPELHAAEVKMHLDFMTKQLGLDTLRDILNSSHRDSLPTAGADEGSGGQPAGSDTSNEGAASPVNAAGEGAAAEGEAQPTLSTGDSDATPEI